MHHRLLTPVANLPLVSTIPAANFPPVSMMPVANCHRYHRHRRQICHRCHWHRWQIMGTISGCWHLKVNLKAKIYLYVSSTTQRWPNKIIKIFLIEDFFHLPPWAANISANFRKNSKRSYWNTLGLGGNWFLKRTRNKKSRDNVPLRKGLGRSKPSTNPWNKHKHHVFGDFYYIQASLNRLL